MKWWHWALIVTGVVVVAFVAGRFTAPTLPAKVVEVESTKSQEQIRALTEENTSLKRHTVKRTVTTFNPTTGKPAETVATEDTHVDQVRDTRADVTAVKAVETVKRVEVTNEGPQWFAGPLVVWVPSAPIGQQFNLGLTVGRYLGKLPLLKIPVSAALSVTVPVHKPISVPSFGASLTFGF